MAMVMVTAMGMAMEFMVMRIIKRIKILFFNELKRFLAALNFDH